MKTVSITCKKREKKGKRFSKIDRNEGLLPCVVYGDKKESVAITVLRSDMMAIYRNSDFKDNVLLSLDVEGRTETVMTKYLQQDPVTSRIIHIDFLRVYDKKKVEVNVPITIVGVSKGQKLGGMTIQLLEKIKLLCYPQSVPKALVIDISDLGLGESLSVKDIEKNENFDVLTNPFTALVTVELPRSELSKASEQDEEEGSSDESGEAAEANESGDQAS